MDLVVVVERTIDFLANTWRWTTRDYPVAVTSRHGHPQTTRRPTLSTASLLLELRASV